jgi:hypothetical protein
MVSRLTFVTCLTGLLCLWAGPVQATVRLRASPAYTARPELSHMNAVLADFTCDGRLDLLTDYNAEVSGWYPTYPCFAFYAGRSGRAATDVVFEPHVDLAAEAGYHLFLADDLDGDGLVDAVAAGSLSKKLVVLINSGVGSPPFRDPIRITMGSSPYFGVLDIATVDIEHDGVMDLLVLTAGSGDRLTLYRGSFGPAGLTYALAWASSVSDGPQQFELVDPEADGIDGVVLVNDHGDLFYYRGTGVPTAPFFYDSEMAAVTLGYQLTAADMDNDGRRDIVQCAWVPHIWTLNRMVVLTARHDAQPGEFPFVVASSFEFDATADALYAGDVTGDGVADLAFAWKVNWCAVYVGGGTRAAPDLTYSHAQTLRLGGRYTTLLFGDVNGDEDQDLVCPVFTANHIAVVLRVEGRFREQRCQVVGFWARTLQACDYDGDGHLDLLCDVDGFLGGDNPPGAALLRAESGLLEENPFSEAWRIEGPRVVAVGDFNNDGKLDFVDSDFTCWLFDGGGGWTFRAVDNTVGPIFSVSLPLDVNADGALDLVTTYGEGLGTIVATYLAQAESGVGTGRFMLGGTLQLGSGRAGVRQLRRWDLNGDGLQDVLYIWPKLSVSGTSIDFLINDPMAPGQLQIGGTYVFNQEMQTSRESDLDGDGLLDLVVASPIVSFGWLEILRGVHVEAGGTVQLERIWITDVPEPIWDVDVVDLDGDGELDLLISGADAGLYTMRGLGDFAFEPLQLYHTPDLGDVELVEYTGDGKPDILYASGYNRGIGFIENLSSTSITPVEIQDVQVDDLPVGVRLRWRVSGQAVGAHVLRRAVGADSDWQRLTSAPVVPSSDGRSEFLDDRLPSGFSGEIEYLLEVQAVHGAMRYGPYGHARGQMEFELKLRVAPAPMRTEALVAYSTMQAGPASLSVYDMRGRCVKTLVASEVNPGEHFARWDGRDARGTSVASGVYFIRLNTASGTRCQRVTLAR